MTSQSEAPLTPYEALGGDPVLERIVNRFYDLMDQDSAYRDLREMHAPDLDPMRASLARFLAGWSGGPRDWFEGNPGKCMMSVHKPISINTKVAAQWAEAMERAVSDCGPENKKLGASMAEMLTQLARGMANS